MIFFEKHGVDGKSFDRFLLGVPVFPAHFHRAFELIYVRKGSISISINERELNLKEQEMAVIFSNQIHEFITVDGDESIIIEFAPELVGEFYREYRNKIPVNPVLKVDAKLVEQSFSSVFRQKSFLYEICARLIEETTFVLLEESPKTSLLYKLLLYVETHYQESCTLKEAAKFLQYDYPYVSKLFFRMMNMTYTEYLNHYRIATATYLLNNCEKPIQEIAMECGYENTKTFYRNFRRVMQQTPTEYRKKERKHSGNIHKYLTDRRNDIDNI